MVLEANLSALVYWAQMAHLSPHRQFKKHTQTLKDRACSGICLRVPVVCILCYLLYYPVLTALKLCVCFVQYGYYCTYSQWITCIFLFFAQYPFLLQCSKLLLHYYYTTRDSLRVIIQIFAYEHKSLIPYFVWIQKMLHLKINSQDTQFASIL